MLNLTRELEEEIMIGDSIRIKIVAIKGKQITLGIDAPRSMPVHRREIYKKIKDQGHDDDNIGNRK